MENFERAHGLINKSLKNRKLTENKKKQIKQMLFGYKVNDNKLIQKSMEMQNDYEDSTSVSGYSDLNLTNSSNEDGRTTLILSQDTSRVQDCEDLAPNRNLEEQISDDSYFECSEMNENLPNESSKSGVGSDNESKDKLSFSHESISECNASIDSMESNEFDSKDFEDKFDSDSGADSETSIVMSGLNLSESDNSEFDADQQLAARIQRQLQIKNNKKMHNYEHSIVSKESVKVKDVAKEPMTKEKCVNIPTQNVLPVSNEASSSQIKKNKRKRKSKKAKCTTLLEEIDVAKGPITKERCIQIQANKVLSLRKDELTLIKENKQRHRDKYTIVLDAEQVKKVLSLSKEELEKIKENKQKHKDKYTIVLDTEQSKKILSMSKAELAQIKDNKQKHKDKYTIVLDPVNIERFDENEEHVLLSVSEDDLSTNGNELCSDELNDEEFSDDELYDKELNYYEQNDSVMSPAYVSITASDMVTQTLDDIVGEYKHSTIRNLPSENSNVFSTNNSGFFVEVDTEFDADIEMEDDVSSLIPELDDTPKLEEVEEELIDFDTTKESTDIITNNTIESEMSDKEPFIDYEHVVDTFKVYYGTNCCIITLKHPSELFVQGKIRITSLAGTLELFGHTLSKESCNIYAPYYNFAQCIKTVENENVYFGLFGKLTALGLTVSEAEDIVTKVGEHDGVVLMQKLKLNKAMDFVENNFKITNMFKLNKTIEPYFSKACQLLDCSIYSSRPYKSFHEHPSWSEANELALNKYSRGVVCGGKGAGKSTYVRYQVNKLLAQGPVLVVDLDPGQSLFTVAGNLSATVVTAPLLGPSFSHLRKPELMLNIGMINTMDNAKLYASAVQTLITYCHNNKAFSHMPWIINTMGMTNSLGLKFITLIITLMQPTYVLQYESEAINQRFETLLTPINVRDLYEEYRNDRLFKNVTCSDDLDYSFVVAHVTSSPHKSTFALRPKDERYLNFLAYFGQLLMMTRGKSLLGVTPYEVSLKDLRIATNVLVKKEHIAKVLNGKLVALCEHASDSGVLFTLTDKPLLCRGHGLIRGIDWKKEMLYVMTPISSDELGGVNTLLYADWAPELMWYEGQVPLGTVLPYRTSTADKQLMSTPRRRFNNPLQLLKMAGGIPN